MLSREGSILQRVQGKQCPGPWTASRPAPPTTAVWAGEGHGEDNQPASAATRARGPCTCHLLKTRSTRPNPCLAELLSGPPPLSGRQQAGGGTSSVVRGFAAQSCPPSAPAMPLNQLQAAARPVGRSALLVQARATRGKPPAKQPAKQPARPTKNSKQAAGKGKGGKAAGGAKGGDLKDGAGKGCCRLVLLA